MVQTDDGAQIGGTSARYRQGRTTVNPLTAAWSEPRWAFDAVGAGGDDGAQVAGGPPRLRQSLGRQ
jgi:hypothetical protein